MADDIDLTPETVQFYLTSMAATCTEIQEYLEELPNVYPEHDWENLINLISSFQQHLHTTQISFTPQLEDQPPEIPDLYSQIYQTVSTMLEEAYGKKVVFELKIDIYDDNIH